MFDVLGSFEAALFPCCLAAADTQTDSKQGIQVKFVKHITQLQTQHNELRKKNLKYDL